MANTTATLSVRRFDPYGNPRGTPPSTWAGDHGFVDGPTDTSLGLTHLGAREYDPTLGRFLSVDPLVDPSNPQTLNAYAYGNNAPPTFTDPDGQALFEGSTSGGTGIVVKDSSKTSQQQAKKQHKRRIQKARQTEHRIMTRHKNTAAKKKAAAKAAARKAETLQKMRKLDNDAYQAHRQRVVTAGILRDLANYGYQSGTGMIAASTSVSNLSSGWSRGSRAGDLYAQSRMRQLESDPLKRWILRAAGNPTVKSVGRRLGFIGMGLAAAGNFSEEGNNLSHALIETVTEIGFGYASGWAITAVCAAASGGTCLLVGAGIVVVTTLVAPYVGEAVSRVWDAGGGLVRSSWSAGGRAVGFVSDLFS